MSTPLSRLQNELKPAKPRPTASFSVYQLLVELYIQF